MKSEDDTDRVNNISQLFRLKNQNPSNTILWTKAEKEKIKKGSREYPNRLLNDYRVSFYLDKPLGLVHSQFP